jgi:hypothetical protein
MQTPLDQPVASGGVKLPALRWLVIYGTYVLVSGFCYTLLMPLITSFTASGADAIRLYYQVLGMCLNIVGAGIAIAIIIQVQHIWCRLVFAGILLMYLYRVLFSAWEMAQ